MRLETDDSMSQGLTVGAFRFKRHRRAGVSMP